jgi:hypothetical protein
MFSAPPHTEDVLISVLCLCPCKGSIWLKVGGVRTLKGTVARLALHLCERASWRWKYRFGSVCATSAWMDSTQICAFDASKCSGSRSLAIAVFALGLLNLIFTTRLNTSHLDYLLADCRVNLFPGCHSIVATKLSLTISLSSDSLVLTL